MERFKDLGDGFLVSSYGYVYSVEREKNLKKYRSRKGSKHIFSICQIKNKQHTFIISKAVADAFVEKPSKYVYDIPFYIDDDPENCTSENLYWGYGKKGLKHEDIEEILDRSNKVIMLSSKFSLSESTIKRYRNEFRGALK